VGESSVDYWAIARPGAAASTNKMSKSSFIASLHKGKPSHFRLVRSLDEQSDSSPVYRYL